MGGQPTTEHGRDASRTRSSHRRIGAIAATVAVLCLGAACEALPPAEPRPWSQLAAWEHAWDAGELTAYPDDGLAYGMPFAYRVASVPDSAGDTPLVRDDGSYQSLFHVPDPAPGPIYEYSSPSFAGHPAWRSDVILPSSGYFDNFHSMLSPQTDKDDRSQWYGWNQSWWGAMLVAPVESDGGHEDLSIDGDPGMTTMMLRPTISISTWKHAWDTGPHIDSGVAPAVGQSVLIVWEVNGTSSWLDVTYRDATGVHTSHVTGAQASGVLNVLHSGWSHMNETATLGLARGNCDPDTLARLHEWASPYLTAPAA